MPPKKAAEKAHILPLNDDEIAFCWRVLVDEGKVSVPKLQKFMEEVCGTKVTPMQARDILCYMDANGDGRVGMEDFKYFMSIGTLADTDPHSFMFEPKAKYRREHEVATKFYKDRDDGVDVHHGMQAVALMFHSQNPKDADAKASDSASSAIARGNSTAKRRSLKGDAPPIATEQHVEDSSMKDEPTAKSPKAKPVNDKLAAKIDAALSKYESQSWEKLLQAEQQFKRDLFDRWADSSTEEINMTEYHKMLTKWYRLARLWVPGELRPADSLASFDYLRRREREAKGDASAAQATESDVEARMGYQLWLDVTSGMYRPEEHVNYVTQSTHHK